MSALVTNTIAIGFYLAASICLFVLIVRKHSLSTPLLSTLIVLATTSHCVGLYQLMFLENGIDLAIHNMFSLVILVINVLVLLSSVKKPLQNLFIALLPLTITAISFSLFLRESNHLFIAVTPGVSAHIILSIIAYGLLSMASLQALLWSWQSHQIKRHRLSGVAQLLPPLQTMELLIFDILWVGVILLAAAITVGFIYLEDIFDQHLIHKTVLSLFALSVFSALLWGRHYLGWRGNIAVKWILSGFCLLMLSYFGSKVALELIINNR